MNASSGDYISQQLEQRIETRSLTLPMLPQVTTQVVALVNNIDSDALALAKLIQSDQALAGHVMRIANSAAYSPSSDITSLQQAIARLGMQTIAEIALATTMGPSMFAAEGFESIVKSLWRSSLATAVWAREISRQCRRNVESSFLCGLLHQIGCPVVLQTVLQICRDNEFTIDAETIEALMNSYQAQTGIVLADHWQLPAAVKHTISGIAEGGTAEGSQSIVDTVKAAKVFAHFTLTNEGYDGDAISAHQNVMEINLYVEDVLQLIEKSDAVHETLTALSV